MKEQFTSLEIIELLFGPISPGLDLPTKTISIFKDNRASRLNFGRLGIFNDALGYVHTARPIDATKIRGTITGIGNNFTEVHRSRLRVGQVPSDKVLSLSAW